MSLYVCLHQNNYDEFLEWPFAYRIKFTLLQQGVSSDVRSNYAREFDPFKQFRLEKVAIKGDQVEEKKSEKEGGESENLENEKENGSQKQDNNQENENPEEKPTYKIVMNSNAEKFIGKPQKEQSDYFGFPRFIEIEKIQNEDNGYVLADCIFIAVSVQKNLDDWEEKIGRTKSDGFNILLLIWADKT